MKHSFVLCMAGEGLRFRNQSLQSSKPFLKIYGQSLLEISLKSLPLGDNDQLIFLHRLDNTEISELFKICDRLDITDISFKKLATPTRGQLETAFLSEELVKHASLSFFNCDTSFHCSQLGPLIHESPSTTNWVPCAQMPGAEWSFFKTKSHNLEVVESTEKIRISEWASVGYYHFCKTELFYRLAHKEIKKADRNELYIAPLYNELILAGEKVAVVACERFRPLGTPDQIQKYGDISWTQFIQENSLR